MQHESLITRRLRAGVLRASSAAILAAVTACGIPTSVPDAPLVDVRWVVPSKSSIITVDKLLPSTVSATSDSTGFNISASAASVTRTLSQDCSACVALNGLTAPKPAFVANASASTNLPSEIASATIIGGSLQVQIKNGYTFDPLRPNPTAGSPNGWATITVSSGTSVIGRDSVNGATTALPAGTTLTRTIPLLGVISGAQPLTVAMSMNSPQGEARPIDASKTLVVTATPSALTVANVTVSVVNKSVSSTSTNDLTDIDSSIVKHAQGGAIILTIANPFTVAGQLTLKLTPQGGATITKTVALAAGSTTPTPIALTKDELKSLLGHMVTIDYSGVLNSPSPVNISPKQVVVITTKLDISLQLGG